VCTWRTNFIQWVAAMRQSRALAFGGFLAGVIAGGLVFVPSTGIGRRAQQSRASKVERLQVSNGGKQELETNSVVSFMAAVGILAAVAAVWTPAVANAQKMPYTNSIADQKEFGKKEFKKYNKNDGRLWGPEPNQKYVQPTTEGQPGQRSIPPAIDIATLYPTRADVEKNAKPLYRNPRECGDEGCQWSRKNVPYPPRG